MLLLPTKQKDTTIAEFNQLRLKNKQPKVSRDLIRHLQILLHVDSKNLVKFRKFEKELSFQNDVDATSQAMWAIRILLADLDINSISEVQNFPSLLYEKFIERFPVLAEKNGKTLQRICEKFVEKYFPKNISDSYLKALVAAYQSIYETCKTGKEAELIHTGEFQDQNKLIQNIISELNKIQNIVKDSHEGGVLGKLFTGKLKNKEGIIGKIDIVITLLNSLSDLTGKINKTSSEKDLLVQKLQADYENVLFVKSQLENDLYGFKEKVNNLEEKNVNIEKELYDRGETLEKAHEKIAYLQQKVDTIPDLESRMNMLRDELNTAKDISLRLYRRVSKIKNDLHRIDRTRPLPKTNNNHGQETQQIS